jgi:hypothetical protein
MSTLRQAEANRENAQRSTGPKSEAGRAASKWNALKHGLTAASVVIPGEDPEQLDTLHAELLEAWEPADAMEADLVWRMAMAQWQLRRSFMVEALMLELQMFRAQHDQAREDLQTASGELSDIGTATDPRLIELFGGPTLDAEKAAELRDRVTQERDGHRESARKTKAQVIKRIGNVGNAFSRLTGNESGIMALLRYRAACEGTYYRALQTLEHFQAKRKRTSSAPTA